MKKFLPAALLAFLLLFVFFDKPKAQYQCGANGRQCCTTGPSPCNDPSLSCQGGFCRPSTSTVPTGSEGNKVAEPQMAPVACDDNSKTYNFNSDRPYQASLCGGRPITFWCGNKVVISLGTVSTGYDPGKCPGLVCNVDINKAVKTLAIDLSGVQVPILGNTQLTSNSQSVADQMDDATKMNEYVSWYLGGVNNRAEFGDSKNTNEEVVNFSGPLQKLLPSSIQDAARINSIAQATIKKTYTSDNNGDAGTKDVKVTEPENHNQIVVCANNSVNQWAPQWVLDFLGVGSIGRVKPVNCYPSNKSAATGDIVRKLQDWNGESISQDVIDTVAKFLPKVYPNNVVVKFLSDTANRWKKRTPPLPWSNEDGKPFATSDDYLKAYNEWRGQLCIFISAFGTRHLLCSGGLIPVTNPYADLFPYIPLANTTDKKGAQMVTGVVITADNPSEASVTSYDLTHSPVLYIAHTQEDFDLSTLLKSTFKPYQKTSGKEGVSVPSDVEQNPPPKCQIIKSSTNPGDDATFASPLSQIRIDNLSYHVSKIGCKESIDYPCNVYYPGSKVCDPTYGHSTTPVATYDCSTTIYAEIPSISKTPYATDIFNNTVAGSDSIFRRIYPKTGATSPVSCIADNPGVSPVTYTIDSVSSKGLELLGAKMPPDYKEKSQSPNVYFPHLGSVYDYFLKGIQTALRPQGFGDPTPQSGQYCTNIKCGELPAGLPKASGACTLGSISSKVGKIPKSLKDIVEAAAQTFNVPSNLILGVMYGEGAFNTDTSGNYSKYVWTDQNTKNWATCMPLPNCSAGSDPIDSIVPFYHTNWDPLAKSNEVISALKKIDPSKTQADPCNLLDVTFVLAKDLHDNAGGGSVAGNKCFGITMTSSIPNSCSSTSWPDGTYESAIKMWENGNDPACYTKPGTCLAGNNGSTCPLNSTDPACETASSHNSNPNISSHNACVWDVAHGK